MTPLQRRLAGPLASASANRAIHALIELLNGWRFGYPTGEERTQLVRRLHAAYSDVPGLPEIGIEEMMEAFNAGQFEKETP